MNGLMRVGLWSAAIAAIAVVAGWAPLAVWLESHDKLAAWARAVGSIAAIAAGAAAVSWQVHRQASIQAEQLRAEEVRRLQITGAGVFECRVEAFSIEDASELTLGVEGQVDELPAMLRSLSTIGPLDLSDWRAGYAVNTAAISFAGVEARLDAGLWTIPAMRMKRQKDGKENGPPHVVPLPRQAIEILRALHPITGHGVMVFPGERSHERPISDNTLRAALLTLGYGPTVHTVHGFRATARTMVRERLRVDPRVIEARLAHSSKNINGGAYDRAEYVEERVVMIQQWAGYLNKLAAGGEVIELRAG